MNKLVALKYMAADIKKLKDCVRNNNGFGYYHTWAEVNLTACTNTKWMSETIIHEFMLTLNWQKNQMGLLSYSDFLVYEYQKVKQYSSKATKNAFDYDEILIPINILNTHWTMMYVCIKSKSIYYFDAMNGSGFIYLKHCLNWLFDEYYVKYAVVMKDLGNWSLYDKALGVSYQRNGHDCGTYIMMMMECILNQTSVTCCCVPEKILEYYRCYIGCCIIKNSQSTITSSMKSGDIVDVTTPVKVTIYKKNNYNNAIVDDLTTPIKIKQKQHTHNTIDGASQQSNHLFIENVAIDSPISKLSPKNCKKLQAILNDTSIELPLPEIGDHLYTLVRNKEEDRGNVCYGIVESIDEQK